MIERAYHLADRIRGDARVERGGVELGMAQQDLDHADIDAVLQEMGGKAVPQRVRSDPLGDLGGLRGHVTGARELTGRHRLHRVAAAREKPAARPATLPPLAQ